MKPTQEYLQEYFRYEPDTGLFYRTKPVRGWNGSKNPCGTINKKGYICIMINYKVYKAHHLAWLYVNGTWPDKQIDHINGIRSDNRIKNLKLATNQQNSFNRGKNRNNTSGYKGVSYHKRSKKYCSHIRVNGKLHHLKTSADPLICSAAYEDAAKIIHGDFYYKLNR